jgi:hypothetical protein
MYILIKKYNELQLEYMEPVIRIRGILIRIRNWIRTLDFGF